MSWCLRGKNSQLNIRGFGGVFRLYHVNNFHRNDGSDPVEENQPSCSNCARAGQPNLFDNWSDFPICVRRC